MTKPLSQPIVRELRAAGWEIQTRRNGHLVARHPAATAPLYMSATPSDHRAAHRTRSIARRLLAEEATS